MKSAPISMIQEGRQLSAIRLKATFKYKTSGAHNPTGDINTVKIKVYGINKDGHSLIATCPMTTNSVYSNTGYASCITSVIPVKEYPDVIWEYDPTGTDLDKFVGPIHMFVESREFPDILDNTVMEKSI